MAKPKSGPQGRDNSKFIFRNNRLLIGWTNNRTEVWLEEISTEELARANSTNGGTATSTEPTTTNRVRVYTAAVGSAMAIGVMAVSEAHPAVLQPDADTVVTSSTFEMLEEPQRLELFANRLAGVKNGQWNYYERKGGKMKAFECVDDTKAEPSATPEPTITEQYARQQANADDHVNDTLNAFDQMDMDVDMDVHPSPTEGMACMTDYREVPEYRQAPVWASRDRSGKQ